MEDFEAGQYYVGDLCYVTTDEEWGEIVSLLFGHPSKHVFTLKNGKKIGILNTMHGDGMYEDQSGLSYPVDSGTLGCMKYQDITKKHNAGTSDEGSQIDGQNIAFDYPFGIESHGGTLCFGHIEISTGHDDGGDADDDEDDAGDDDEI